MSNHEAIEGSEPFFSKRRLAWAGIAAVGGCAACCAFPWVAALGLGGGAAIAIAGAIRPGTELLVGASAFVSMLAFMAVRRTLKRQPASSARDAGCGCGAGARSSAPVYASPKNDGHEPVACTFDMKDMGAAEAHLDGYRAAFAHLLRTERFPGGFRWVFRAEPALESQLKSLAEREHGCCRFLNFELTRDGDSITWTTTADVDAAAVLEAYCLLPETLRGQLQPGQDISVLRRAFAGSGLAFPGE